MAEVPNKVMQLFQFMNESVWNHAALDLFFSYCANDEAPLWTRWSGGCQAWIELCRFLVSALYVIKFIVLDSFIKPNHSFRAPKLINYTVQHNPGLLQTILQNIHITKLYELLPEWLMNGEWADYLVSEPIMVQNTLRETYVTNSSSAYLHYANFKCFIGFCSLHYGLLKQWMPKLKLASST